MQITLNKKEQSEVVKLFKGSKQVESLSPKKIAERTGLPKRQVYRVLQHQGLASFSESTLR